MTIIADEINNQITTPDSPEPNPSQQLETLRDMIKIMVEGQLEQMDSQGHVYPVAMVSNWTKEISGYNKQLQGYVEEFNKINLDKVDRTWLQKQVRKFVDWIKEQLNKLKQKIIKALKGMMKPIKKAMGLVKPILSPPSLDTIVTWALGIIAIFMEPYMKIVQFISDFTTYTPPLVSESASLAATTASIPGTITSKVSQLQGEGAEIVQESIANAVSEVTFSPVSMGDVLG